MEQTSARLLTDSSAACAVVGVLSHQRLQCGGQQSQAQKPARTAACCFSACRHKLMPTGNCKKYNNTRKTTPRLSNTRLSNRAQLTRAEVPCAFAQSLLVLASSAGESAK